MECHRQNGARIPARSPKCFACDAPTNVPQLRRVIETARQQKLTVRRKGDRADDIGVAPEDVLLLARGDVPESYGLIRAARGQALGARAECDTVDETGVAFKCEEGSTS